MRKWTLFIALGAVVLLGGFLSLSLSTTHTLGKLTSRHEPYLAAQTSHSQTLPASLSVPFDYFRRTFVNARIREIESAGTYVASEIRFEGAAAVPGGTGEMTLEWFQPRSADRSPVVVILPIMTSSLAIERFFARYYARRGIAVVILTEVHKLSGTEEVALLDVGLRQTVVRARQAIDWIETRSELDAARIGVLGFSMGGIRASLLAAVDDRVRASTLALVGSDLPFIVAYSTENGFARMRAHQLETFGRTPEELEKELRAALLTDPGLYAPFIDAEHTLLILAAYDTVVPYAKGLDLRQRIGNPETITLPTGHYSSVLYSLYIRSATLDFFRRKLR